MNLKQEIYELKDLLSRLIGEHKELLELTREERKRLVDVDIQKIDEITCKKELLLHQVQKTELARIEKLKRIALALNIPPENLKLSALIDQIYKVDLALADQMRSSANTLQVLLKRIQEQNQDNGDFVTKTLENIEQMKANIIHGLQPKSNTYSAKGKKAQSASMNQSVISTEV